MCNWLPYFQGLAAELSFPAGRAKRSYLLPLENFKLPYLPHQAH